MYPYLYCLSDHDSPFKEIDALLTTLDVSERGFYPT